MTTRPFATTRIGDEFNVLLDDVGDEKDVARLARALLATVSEPVDLQNQVVALSASIGISFYPQDATEVEALVTHADMELPSRVARILDESGWPPSLLCLEITEGTIMGQEDPEETLKRLGDLGVRLAIDDFGIGYSSLGSLRHFPVDVLKIDRTFTHGIPENADNLTLVRTIIALAGGRYPPRKSRRCC